MCDPSILATISAVSTVAGLAGSGMSALSSMNAQKKQKQEIEAWQRKQAMNREAQQVRQEQLRGQAEAARQQGVQAVGAENQKKVQAEEEARLTKYLQGQGEAAQATPEAGAAPVSGADLLKTAGVTGDKEITNDLAYKLNQATKGAQQRLQALAGVSSYGGSSGGLGTVNPLAQQASGQGIDLANNMRKGELAVYDLQQGINPVQIQANANPLSDLFSFMTQVGSAGMAKGAGGAAAAGASAIGDPWGGLRYVSTPSSVKVPFSKTGSIF
jgi:hypothetical protein